MHICIRALALLPRSPDASSVQPAILARRLTDVVSPMRARQSFCSSHLSCLVTAVLSISTRLHPFQRPHYSGCIPRCKSPIITSLIGKRSLQVLRLQVEGHRLEWFSHLWYTRYVTGN